MGPGYSGAAGDATGEAREDWVGAKGALLLGDRLLVTQRDDYDWIPYPGHWDFVGGEREPGETPRETLIRETREEVGLDVSGAEWLWEARFPSFADPSRGSWFFVLRLPAGAEAEIVFGDEGQGWRLIPPQDFLAMPGAVPALQERLEVWLDTLGERPAST
jgi:8-oxo-dGTP diphosphatase